MESIDVHLYSFKHTLIGTVQLPCMQKHLQFNGMYFEFNTGMNAYLQYYPFTVLEIILPNLTKFKITQ
jgi:hypothetical protein